MRINIIVFGSMVNGGIARSPDKSLVPDSPVLDSAATATRGGPQQNIFSHDNVDSISDIDRITSKIHEMKALVCSLN